MEQPLAPEIVSTPVQAPVRPTTPRDPQDVLTQILTGLGIEAKITADTTSGVPRFRIDTPEPGRLIGKHGQTLSQLQFLVNRILFRHDPNAPRVTLDCDGPREQPTNGDKPAQREQPAHREQAQREQPRRDEPAHRNQSSPRDPRTRREQQAHRDQSPRRDPPPHREQPTHREQPVHQDQPTPDLLNKCAEAANKVRRWGEEVLIGPFESSERQVIQGHFATDPEIEAIAEGGAETAEKENSPPHPPNPALRPRPKAPVSRLLEITVHPQRGAPLQCLAQVALTAHGVTGDVPRTKTKRQVTVVAREAWESACADLDATVPWTARRANLLIEGINLEQTTGQHLRIGSVLLEITGETEPCGLMDEQHPGLQAALKPHWRAGVTCRILEPGEIQVGDPVELI